MPRQTNQQFIDRHNQLSKIWLRDPGAFAYLSTAEQRTLHLYYVPGEPLDRDQLEEHRTQITVANRELAKKAGRAFHALVKGKDHGATTGPMIIRTGRLKSHRLTTRAVVKPKPDLGKIASALVEIARAKLDHEKKEAA